MSTLTVEERNFLVRRKMQQDHRWVGSSSDAMVVAAITGEEPTDWPFDGWDLGRCMITRRVAPPHLHAAMDAYIEQAKPKVEGSYHGLEAAKKMAEEDGPAVEEMRAKPHWCDIPDQPGEESSHGHRR